MNTNKTINVETLGETLAVPAGTTIQEIADKLADRFSAPVTLAKTGNVMKELRSKLNNDAKIELLDITNTDGMRVYQRSVSLLMIAAARDVLGKEKQVVICHAIKKNVYCEIPGYVPTQDDLAAIEERMRELARLDLPIEKHPYHLDEAMDIMNACGMRDKAELFRYRNTFAVNLYSLGDVYDYFYGYMTSSTGCLKLFKLVKEADGFVLMFPTTQNPAVIDEYMPLNIIAGVFREYKNYGRILGISTAGDLNNHIAGYKFTETVHIEEALHEKKIASIADMILNRGNVSLVLIAGPSSSGKTTFAHRLSVQLRVNGIKTHAISLDDYFRNRSEAPLDESGNPNFEAFEFLNTELLNENLKKLMNGEEITAPKYNFLTGMSETSERKMRLNENEIIIAEGIHGLNSELTKEIPAERKFKIFISALTPLSIDNHNRISTSDNRLLRRLVRDHRTRGASASRTISMWPSVLAGEAEYIFPTQPEADTVFNSSLIYELSVLKQFAEPLLFGIDRDSPLYAESKRLIRFLSWFLGAPTEDIPKNSVMREFIGGSCFPV